MPTIYLISENVLAPGLYQHHVVRQVMPVKCILDFGTSFFLNNVPRLELDFSLHLMLKNGVFCLKFLLI